MTRANSYEQNVSSVEQIPLFDTVTVYDQDHNPLDQFKGIRRLDTRKIVAVQSDKYALVQHREVATAVRSVAQSLGVPMSDYFSANGLNHFAPQRIRLYDGGRSLEYRLVVPQKIRLQSGEEFYPGLRVTNSVNGKLAVAVSGFSLRLACTNQLVVGFNARNQISGVRELHLTSAGDLLGSVQKGIYEFLEEFEGTLDLYQKAMELRMKAIDVPSRLKSVDFPERHTAAIGSAVMALGEPEVTQWDAYQAATEYLTHRIDVSPARELALERRAAQALLLPFKEEGSVSAITAVEA